MIKFIDNIGDFFSTNYFDEDFVKKVHNKSGFSVEDQKELQKRISPLKDKYFKFKQSIIEGRLRTKDKVYETHQFHTLLLNALGYDGAHHQYDEPFHFSETEVLPVRHKLYRGDKLHMMVMQVYLNSAIILKRKSYKLKNNVITGYNGAEFLKLMIV